MQLAEAQHTLQQERARADGMARDLAAAKKAADKPDNAKELTEARQALQQERTKAEGLARDLAAARQESEAQAAALKAASQKPDTSKQLAEAQQALQQERSRSDALARDLAATRRQTETEVATVAPRSEPATATPSPPAPTAADPETRRLMVRARQLIDQGNIMAARSMLERASESGYPQAVFALAETFDPNQLAAWGTVGTQGDAARARQLYQKALAGGVPEADARLKALHP
jgi:hypothetical protein